MRINNNIPAMNTHRQYSINNANIAKSVAKLSSGYRINSAADDAAGLAISEKMRAQIRGLQMASKNSQDAISLVQTAEGALQTTHDILQRMRELAVQSASDTNETTIDRAALDREFQALKAEIDETARITRFNDQALIDGTFQKEGTDFTAASGFATRVADADGKVTSTNVQYTRKTEAGTYTFAASVDNNTTETAAATAPTGKATGALAGEKVFEKVLFDFSAKTDNTDYSTEDNAPTVTITATADGDNVVFSFAAVDSSTGAQANTYGLTMSAADLATGGDVTFGIGHGATVTLNIKAGTSADDIASALNTLVADVHTAADETVEIGASGIQYEWTDGNIPAGTTVDGLYTFELSGDLAAGQDDLQLKMLDANSGEYIATASIDLTDIDPDTGSGTITFDFGELGALKVTVPAGGFADLEEILGQIADDFDVANNAESGITFSGGAAAETVDKPRAKFDITNADGSTETVYMEVGSKSVTSSKGVTINFDKALTDEDLTDLSTYLGGSTSGSVTIGKTTGQNMVIQTGANQGDELSINIDKMDAWNLGIDVSNISDRLSSSKAITEVNDALNTVSTQRSELGALQNRLEFKIQNLDISAENLQAAESRIRDLDMAKEMTNFTRNNILAQAATAMLAQANALPQGVLQLLG